MRQQPEQDYAVPDAARLLACSERQVWRLLEAGLLSYRRLGRRTTIPASAIAAYQTAILRPARRWRVVDTA